MHPEESGLERLFWEPISIATLATHLVKQGYSVITYDSRTREDAEDILAENKDDLLCIGVSAMVGYQIVDGYYFSKKIKESFPYIPVIWGGWFPTVFPDQCLESPYIDMVVKGQGEKSLLEVVKKLKAGISINEIVGISCKDNGRIIHRRSRSLEDMNNFLPVDYELLDISKYTMSRGILHYISSVGCPYNCAFCGISPYTQQKWYGLNPQRVVQEIKSLYKKYQLNEIIFYDSTFFVNLKRSKEILSGFVEENMKFRWSANSHVRQAASFDDEMLELLKASNCSGIELGIESGSTRIREIFRKNFSNETIASAIEKLADAEIPVNANYIVAPPMEEEDDFIETVRSMTAVMNAFPNNRLTMYQWLPPTPGAELAENTSPPSLTEYGIAQWFAFYEQTLADQVEPWLSRRDKYGRQPVLFYVKMSHFDPSRYGKIKTLLVKILKKLANFRLRHEVYLFPFEWFLFRNIRSLFRKR